MVENQILFSLIFLKLDKYKKYFLCFTDTEQKRLTFDRPLSELGKTNPAFRILWTKQLGIRRGNKLKNDEVTDQNHNRGGLGRRVEIPQPSLLDLHTHFLL